MPRKKGITRKASSKNSKTELKTRLNAVCDAVRKSCPSEWSGDDPIVVLRAERIANIPTFSTGSLALDKKMGGGYAWGRIIEVYGPESAGKSTLMLHAIASVQGINSTNMCALIDSENSFDPMYAQRLNVDVESLLVSQPDSGEHALNIMMELLKNDVKLVVVDSVAALTPRDMFEGEIGDKTIGKHARLMSEGLRSLNTLLSKKQSTVIFTNQIRTLIGQNNASMSSSTTGGKALRFYASQRIEVRRIGSETNSEGEAINNIVQAKVAKNKIAPPFGKCSFKIRFGKGVDPIDQIIDFAIDFDLIKKSGAWLSIECMGGERFQGRQNLYNVLEKDEKIFSELQKAVMTKINDDTDEDPKPPKKSESDEEQSDEEAPDEETPDEELSDEESSDEESSDEDNESNQIDVSEV